MEKKSQEDENSQRDSKVRQEQHQDTAMKASATSILLQCMIPHGAWERLNISSGCQSWD